MGPHSVLRCYTLAQVAALLQTSRETAVRVLGEHRIRVFVLGPGVGYRVPESEVVRLLEMAVEMPLSRSYTRRYDAEYQRRRRQEIKRRLAA